MRSQHDRVAGLEFERAGVLASRILASEAKSTAAEVVEGFVGGVARVARGEFEQDAAELAEVDRPEPVAVDLGGRAQALRLDGLAHRLLVLVGRRLEGDVVDRAEALSAALDGRQPLRAADLPHRAGVSPRGRRARRAGA